MKRGTDFTKQLTICSPEHHLEIWTFRADRYYMFFKQVRPRSVSNVFPNNPLNYEVLLHRTADVNSGLSPLPLFPPSSLFIYPVYQPHKHTMSLNKKWVAEPCHGRSTGVFHSGLPNPGGSSWNVDNLLASRCGCCKCCLSLVGTHIYSRGRM